MCRLFLILQSNAYFNPPDPSNRREETNFADSLFPAFCQKIMLFEFLPFNFLMLYPSFSIELTSTSTISTSAYLCDINSFLVWTLCCQIYIPEQNCDIWETFFFDSQTSYHFKTLVSRKECFMQDSLKLLWSSVNLHAGDTYNIGGRANKHVAYSLLSDSLPFRRFSLSATCMLDRF